MDDKEYTKENIGYLIEEVNRLDKKCQECERERLRLIIRQVEKDNEIGRFLFYIFLIAVMVIPIAMLFVR